MCHLMRQTHSEKCIFRQFCHCANIIECALKSLDGIAYHTDIWAVWYSLLFLLGYKPVRHVTMKNNTRLNQAQEKIMQSRHSK